MDHESDSDELEDFYPDERTRYRIKPAYGYQVELEGRPERDYVTLTAREWHQLEAFVGMVRDSSSLWPDYQHLAPNVIRVLDNWRQTRSQRFPTAPEPLNTPPKAPKPIVF